MSDLPPTQGHNINPLSSEAAQLNGTKPSSQLPQPPLSEEGNTIFTRQTAPISGGECADEAIFSRQTAPIMEGVRAGSDTANDTLFSRQTAPICPNDPTTRK